MAVAATELGAPPQRRAGDLRRDVRVEERAVGDGVAIRRPHGIALMHRRDAMIQLRSGSDVELAAKRTRDFLLEEFAERLARRAANHFADQRTVGDRVIANTLARCPPRLLARKKVNGRLALGEIVARYILRPPGPPGH